MKNTKLVFGFFLIVLCSLLSCSSGVKDHSGLSKEKIEELKKIQRKHVIHKKEFWAKYLGEKVEDRLFSASPEMVEYLVRDNKIWGIPTQPKAYPLSVDEREIFKQVIREFSSSMKKMMEKNLLGVFIVEGLGSSALTDGIRAFPKKSFMVFDRKVFQKKANEWCSWKENTPFKEGPYKISCRIRNENENNIKGAFQYIFTHELAHVYNSQDRVLLPFWDDDLAKVKTGDYPFLRISWKNGDKRFERKEYDKDYKDIFYYGADKTKVSNELSLPLYQKLKGGGFPSLYGVTNPWDDFAEGFVVYYHTKVLKKPFSITVSDSNSSKRLVYKSCLQTGSCPKKEKVFKRIFSN